MKDYVNYVENEIVNIYKVQYEDDGSTTLIKFQVSQEYFEENTGEDFESWALSAGDDDIDDLYESASDDGELIDEEIVKR